MGIRWLHISDIHECKRDMHLRKRMYDQIIEKGIEGQPAPDFVFLTGDMAFAGSEDEYLSLEKAFIEPLRNSLPPDCPIFTIPGNHDVDRDQMIEPRLWFAHADKRRAFQAIDDAGAKFRRQMLLPRFSAYAAFDQRVSDWHSPWLDSEAGAVWWSNDVNGAKVALVGVNTAWLCQDDDDWGKLTPGREMVANALREVTVTKPDLLIVLGHHPLGALQGEGDVSDGDRVTRRLEQANALYLHGHRHRTQSTRIGYDTRSVVSLQAPSAYQAHDNPRWRNGLMWGEVDIINGSLLIQPRQWNEDNEEYNWETGAGYEADKVAEREGFRLRLPGRSAPIEIPVSVAAPKPKPPLTPQGWEIVDKDALAKIRANPPLLDEMIQFFDGILPTWQFALAYGVQPRSIAGRLASRLHAIHAGAAKPHVVLLSGAGGEGKSTALLHAAAVLVEDTQQAWTCLHRQAANAPLPEDTFSKLPMIPGHAWVVVIDDADNIGPAILAAVKKVAVRTDVHLLLAARDAEWHLKKLVPGIWQPIADFRTELLAGLDREDASRIVSGWVAWGEDAMGKLKGRSEGDAVTALLGHARDFATRKEDGELLGALLVTRQGEDMRAHVRTLIEGLGRSPAIGAYALRDIYAMVAAMHAENQLYLSRSLLAFALSCDVDELERRALVPLRREAMLDAGDSYVLTRHRRIAEAACAVMREDNDDVDRWYTLLARSARRAFTKNAFTFGLDIQGWNTELANHFIMQDERRWSVARAVAKAAHEGDPTNAFLLSTFSSVLRRTNHAAEALTLLKSTGERFREDRALLNEWGAVAGATGDHGLACWLQARSMSDGGNLTSRQFKLSLAGLGIAFRALFEETRKIIFATGQSACGQLGLRLPEIDERTRRNFEAGVKEGHSNGIADLASQQAIEMMHLAVVQGANEVEPDNDPVFFEKFLGEPDSYHYKSLLRAVDGAKSSPPRSEKKRS